MNYRFVATTVDGEVRRGYLEADSEDAAIRQLERRGLRPNSLEQNLAEAPVHVEAVDTPLAAPAPPRQVAPPWYRELDFGKLAGALALACLCTWVVFLILGKVMSDPVYRVRLSGRVLLQMKRQPTKDPRPYFRIYVWFPESSLVADAKGNIWRKGGKQWQKLPQRADAHCTWGAEGVFQLNLEVPLPNPPKNCIVAVDGRGYEMVNRGCPLRPDGSNLKGDLPTMHMRWFRRPRKESGKGRKPGSQRRSKAPNSRLRRSNSK